MAVTVISNGVPVELDRRLWSFNAKIEKYADNAYVTDYGHEENLLDPRYVWKTQRSVRTVLGFLANNLGQVPLHAFELNAQGDRDRLRVGTLAEVMRSPHPQVTPFSFVQQVKLDRSLWGKYAALKVNQNGFQLVRLPPWKWKFERDITGIPTAVLWKRSDDAIVRFELDSVLWMDGYFAGSDDNPMASLFDLLTEQHEAGRYRTELWRNGARVPGWIERPSSAPDWSPNARENFRTSWNAYASGGTKAGRTPILEDDMSYHEASNGVTPEAAQQLEARKLSIAEVASAFHLPPVFAGLLDSTSHSNVTAYREQLYSDVLGPDFMEMSQAINLRLVPDLAANADQFVEFNVQEKLRMAFDEQARIFQTATGGPIMTRNEARKRMNYPAIDGADELIVPLNVIEGGQASPTDSAPIGGAS